MDHSRGSRVFLKYEFVQLRRTFTKLCSLKTIQISTLFALFWFLGSASQLKQVDLLIFDSLGELGIDFIAQAVF